ncbi:EamA family transporter RarD [Litorimonas sp. RW-G-Af-16]
MSQTPNINADGEHRKGLIAGLAAYTWWGLFPVYFVLTKAVPALEILSHRVLWSVPFCFLILLMRQQLPALWTALRDTKTVLYLGIAAVFLSINWGVYIWAVQNEQIFQGSLGYYINPLLYVLVGVVFFGERMSRLQTLAIVLALLGVTVLTVYGGVFPWISLILGVTFTSYGVFKKQVNIGAMPGLQIETLVLFIPAAALMFYISQTEGLGFTNVSREIDFLLLLAGPVTVLPLLAFSFAARRIKLSTLGFLQYVGPTLQFGCGLYFGETFTPAHAICFILIWTGVAIFAWDSWRKRPLPTP